MHQFAAEIKFSIQPVQFQKALETMSDKYSVKFPCAILPKSKTSDVGKKLIQAKKPHVLLVLTYSHFGFRF